MSTPTAPIPVVVVTGASAGVGRATAIAFARQGARVALLARGEAGLKGAAAEVEQAGGTALIIPVDVADAEALERAATEVEDALGPIDVWVNAAMVTVFGRIADIDPAEIRRVTEVTYLGTVHGTQTALKRMSARDHGIIIQVGSALAYRSIPLQAAYCAAKSAVRAFTDSLRCELLHLGSNVQLTMVQLAAFNTPQFSWARNRMPKEPQPLAPIFQPELAAQAIVKAAARPRREVWVGFPAVKAILGQRIAPSIADRMMADQAWSGQLTDADADPVHPDNLFEPLDRDRDMGAHGPFDSTASMNGWQRWAAQHWPAAAAVAVFAVVAGLAGMAVAG